MNTTEPFVFKLTSIQEVDLKGISIDIMHTI